MLKFTSQVVVCIVVMGFLVMSLFTVGTSQTLLEQSLILGPYSDALNMVADLTGVKDPRPAIWGLDGSQSVVVPFEDVPEGYRVRVLSLTGNYMAWARAAYRPGKHVGTSWGIKTSYPDGSLHLPQFGASNCFAYLEYGLSNGEVNQPFNIDTHVGGLLGVDNTLTFVSAVYLNDEMIPVHMETTFTMIYQFEKQSFYIAREK